MQNTVIVIIFIIIMINRTLFQVKLICELFSRVPTVETHFDDGNNSNADRR
jgi:hypothetical protein